MNPTQPSQPNHEIGSVEEQIVAVFVDGVRVLGLPPSLGEIYGILFVSESPLSLDDLVQRLDISKGSASQGIRTLKNLGAIREAERVSPTERRTYYEPAVDLKRLVGGFIKEQIRPHLESGQSKISQLTESAKSLEDSARKQFLNQRIKRLNQWIQNGGKVLPMIQKILGQ